MYIPIWKRSPNKFIRYELRNFELSPDAYGTILKGTVTIAVFKDRNNKLQEIEAYIKWLE